MLVGGQSCQCADIVCDRLIVVPVIVVRAVQAVTDRALAGTVVRALTAVRAELVGHDIRMLVTLHMQRVKHNETKLIHELSEVIHLRLSNISHSGRLRSLQLRRNARHARYSCDN